MENEGNAADRSREIRLTHHSIDYLFAIQFIPITDPPEILPIEGKGNL